MSKDHLDRNGRAYRKSPGRQYGYEYDPLRSHSGQSQAGSNAASSRSGTLLAQRPDPRRTRQLMRQSIIASKRLDDKVVQDLEHEDAALEFQNYPPETPSRPRAKTTRRFSSASLGQESPSRYQHIPAHLYPEEEEHLSQQPTRHTAQHSGYLPTPQLPSTRQLMQEDQYDQEDWHDRYDQHNQPEDYADADFADNPVPYPHHDVYDEIASHSSRTSSRRRSSSQDVYAPMRNERSVSLPEAVEAIDYERGSKSSRTSRADYEESYREGHIFEEHEELPPGLRVVKKSRRKFLTGVGLVAAGGASTIAALELAPKASIPVLKDVHSVQEAFNHGVAQGADNARKELITALDTLEGFTLQGAIDAARLTRMAYDVFVSPVVKFGAALTKDFLMGMLNAFTTARNWLRSINQDNATLVAIEKVLQAWVDQANQMPKQLDAITQTDLDGAQAYLRALKQKIDDEKAKLNKPTPTPSAQPKASPAPAKKP